MPEVINVWDAPYNVRPSTLANPVDCSGNVSGTAPPTTGYARALYDAEQAGPGTIVSSLACDDGEYYVAPISRAGGFPGINLRSGNHFTSRDGITFCDMPDKPWCWGVVGAYAAHGTVKTGIVVEGVQVRNRALGVTWSSTLQAFVPKNETHVDGFMAYGVAPPTGVEGVSGRVVGFRLINCKALDAPGGDGGYLGAGSEGVEVEDWFSQNHGRYGMCVSGSGQRPGAATGICREGFVFKRLTSDTPSAGVNQSFHVEVDGALHVLGVRMSQVYANGDVVLNRCLGAVLDRVYTDGVIPGDPNGGKGGGILVVNSPDVQITRAGLRFVRGLTLNPDGTLKKASESRPIQFKGDSSGGIIDDVMIEVIPVPSPNVNIPAAIAVGTTSTGVELRNIRARGPAGMSVYSGSPAAIANIAPLAEW